MANQQYYTVGDYMVGKQIGCGSFSTVWHAKHRVHGTEVAIKEIVTTRLNHKLEQSLKSEIFILKRINHPNIIRLHDMIEEPGKIYIILEYCRGGDLSVYIQQNKGKIPEETAKHFMLQLAEGLKVLRENNVIHRDLKPQNLLLSTSDDKSTLKIADFGFARSLQPRGLAETLCGSPLYMAPEIMQLQKYDAKADLWSVGTILFQLVTGKTPYTGNNQEHLLLNIIKSTELQFPPEAKDLNPRCIDLCKKLLRRNPIERLTFEEFFNHPYLAQNQPNQFRNSQSQSQIDGSVLPEMKTRESSLEDCLPSTLDGDSSRPDSRPTSSKGPTKKSLIAFSPDSSVAVRKDTSKYSPGPHKLDMVGFSLGNRRLSEGSVDTQRKVMDSLESIDQDYVIVSGYAPELSSSSVHSFKPSHSSSIKAGGPPVDSRHVKSRTSDPVPITGTKTGRVGNTESLESSTPSTRGNPQGPMDVLKPSDQPPTEAETGRVGNTESLESSTPFTRGNPQEPMDLLNPSDQPPTDSMTRIKSLKRCALAISEIVQDKVKKGKQLEALSVQLVILAIWKQALNICHTHAASAIEGYRNQERKLKDASNSDNNSIDNATIEGPQDVCSRIESAFLQEIEKAEDLAKVIDAGNGEMPDAMELIYQTALAWGIRAAVDESIMGDTENAVLFYSKAVRLLEFLLVEAPCLILSLPFSVPSSDRYRIQNYINALNKRQSILESQRTAVFKAGDDQPPVQSGDDPNV